MFSLHAAQRAVAGHFGRRAFATARTPTSSCFSKKLLWGASFTFPTAVLFGNAISLDAEPVTDAVVDPDTSIEFPKYLRINSKVPLPMYSLLGCGVRTVSFLGIKVYSVGFYADLTNPRLKAIPKTATPEEKIEFVVDNTTCLIRIIPTRNTSYTHLRDAFLRTLNALIQKGIQEKTMSVEEATEAQSPIGQLKSLFPNSKFAKHEPLDLLITPPDPPQPRVLIIRDLGAVTSNWVSKSLFLSYFGVTAPSPALKEQVWKRLEGVGKD